MNPERLDDLLERALAGEPLPGDITPLERAELDAALQRASALRLNAARVRAEADGSVPAARARFQRHLAAQAAPAPVSRPVSVQRANEGWLSRLFRHRALALGGGVAALAVLLVLAVMIVHPFASPETAAALTVDDYVQVSGVVAANQDGALTVQSPELGDLAVTLDSSTSVSGDGGTVDASTLKPGDSVLIGGVVTEKRAITASAVAVARAESAAPPSPAGTDKIELLKQFREGIEGTIALVSLAPNGTDARVLLALPGRPLLVDVERSSLDSLLTNDPTLVGQHVRVLAGRAKHVFALQFIERAPGTPAATNAQPQFQSIQGVVVARAGVNVFRVQTDRGEINVVVRGTTVLRLGESGLTLDDFRAGETVIGHQVSITGNPDRLTPRGIVAEVVVVGPRAPAR